MLFVRFTWLDFICSRETQSELKHCLRCCVMLLRSFARLNSVHRPSLGNVVAGRDPSPTLANLWPPRAKLL
jgi:hypothetical protein